MHPKEYILNSLKELNNLDGITLAPGQTVEDFILKTILSKKFRKYAASEELIEHIKKTIALNIQKQQPINVLFFHGAYKLWRLDAAPHADWAELFALMYFIKWLKPICAVYKPGVWFDIYLDDIILPKINNISMENVETYIKSYLKIHDFLKQYQPKNFKLTLTRNKDMYASMEEFESILKGYVEKLEATNPKFTERALEMVALSAQPTVEQLKDPQWKEKVLLVHDAYITMKREQGYFFNHPEKILSFTQPLSSGMFVAVGSTKKSVAKFWVGKGILEKKGDTYIENILSPSQIEKVKDVPCEKVEMNLIDAQNFKEITIYNILLNFTDIH